MSRHLLFDHLADDRGKRVIFVSHCLLNENTRYLGGAFRRGSVDELVDGFQREGLGIVQMRCPEQCAWGGVSKRHILWIYGAGARRTRLYRLLPLLLPAFRWYTRWCYWWLARGVARDIADYVRSGFEVAGVVGIGGSPSCGVWTTLDLARSVQVIAGCPIAQMERRRLNDEAIIACREQGPGLFMASLQRLLRRRHLAVPWYEHDLLDEIRGQPTHLRASAASLGIELNPGGRTTGTVAQTRTSSTASGRLDQERRATR